MACERFATFYLELESQPDATELLLQSYNCYKAWGAESKMLHLIKRYPFLAAALKATTSALDKSGENLKVGNDSVESISVLTDDLSSASASTWQYQKRVRLSITKWRNRQCELQASSKECLWVNQGKNGKVPAFDFNDSKVVFKFDVEYDYYKIVEYDIL